MKVIASIALALVVIGCEYREQVGRTGGDEVDNPDGSTGGGGDEDCTNFDIPTGDCTSGQTSCNFDMDCTGADGACNLVTRRCFSTSARCVGTPCNFDDDCPVEERCNQTAGVCFGLNESQTCMPCFLTADDCGGGECDTDLGQCL